MGTFNPLEALKYVEQQGDAGRQRGLAQLFGQAVNAAPDQRQAIIGKIAGVDGSAAIDAQKSLQGFDDDQMKSTVQTLHLASQAWAGGNKQLANSLYQRARPGLSHMGGGTDLPPEMDDGAAAAFAHLGEKAQEPYTLSPGSKRFGENNQVVAEVPFAPQMIGVQNAQGGQDYNLIDKGTGQARPVMVGGQQAPTGPRDATEAPIYAQANMMTKAGMPPDKVEAWLNQQLGATPTIVDAATPQAAPPQQLRSAPKPAAPPPTPSGYRFKADGSSLEPIPGGPADNKADGLDLSPDAIDNAAWDHILTGTNLAIGRGKEGIQQRTQVYNRIADIAKQAGVSPADLATQKGKYKALQASLTNTQKQSDSVDRSTETFHRNADLMLSLSAHVPRMDSATLNGYLLNYNLQWKGDPATAAYIAAGRTAVNEYAKIASGAMGGAGSSDTSRREAADAISTAQNPQALAAVIETLKKDASNQQDVNHAKLLDLGGRLSQFGWQQKGQANPDKMTKDAALQHLQDARDAIKAGANKEAVRKRMIQMGLPQLAGRL